MPTIADTDQLGSGGIDNILLKVDPDDNIKPNQTGPYRQHPGTGENLIDDRDELLPKKVYDVKNHLTDQHVRSNHAVVQFNHLNLNENNSPIYSADGTGLELKQLEKDFLIQNSLDKMFLARRSRCPECLQKDTCRICAKSVSKESYEGAIARSKLWDSLEYSPEERIYTHKFNFVNYKHWTVNDLSDNRAQGYQRLIQLEKNLRRHPREVLDDVNRQISEKLASEEWIPLDTFLERYPHLKDVQMRYSALNLAVKLGSSSTPYRLINDPTLSEQLMGPEGSRESVNFNHFLPKSGLGENIFDLCLALRTRPFLSQGDLSKFYPSIRYHPESSLKLAFYIRKGPLCGDGPAQIVIPTRVVFGARDSNTVAQTALLHCLKTHARTPELQRCHLFERSGVLQCYVDDVFLTCFSREELARLSADFIFACEQGGFKIKNLISPDESREMRNNATHLEGVQLMTSDQIEDVLRQIHPHKTMEGDPSPNDTVGVITRENIDPDPDKNLGDVGSTKIKDLRKDEESSFHCNNLGDVEATKIKDLRKDEESSFHCNQLTGNTLPENQSLFTFGQTDYDETVPLYDVNRKYNSSAYLGMILDLKTDSIRSCMNVNCHAKSRGDFVGPSATVLNFSNISPIWRETFLRTF